MQPTASKAELLLACSWPFDPNRTLEFDPPGAAANYGTRFHEVIAKKLSGEPVLGCTDEIFQAVSEADAKLHAYLAQAGFATGRRLVEYAMAYCPRTGTARDTTLDLETHVYSPLSADEIGGTADLIVLPDDPQASILVLDHKTGLSGDFTKPHLVPQLLVLGYAAMARFKRSSFIPAVLWAPRGGLPQVFEGDACGIDLKGSQFIRALSDSLRRIGDGSLRPNKLCPRCPARHDCPARVVDLVERSGELVEKANLVGSELVLVNNDNALSRGERLGRLHLLMSRFDELKKRATQEIKRELHENSELEAVRPDGKTLGLVTKTVERISKASIIKALGKEAGEAELARLRALGCLEETEQEELHAK